MDFDVIIWFDHVVVISLSLVSHENVVVSCNSFVLFCVIRLNSTVLF